MSRAPGLILKIKMLLNDTCPKGVKGWCNLRKNKTRYFLFKLKNNTKFMIDYIFFDKLNSDSYIDHTNIIRKT